MKQLLLHIGTAKTGTSSIQGALANAQRRGALGDVVYPKAVGANHNYLAALYQSPDRLQRLLASRKAADDEAFTARVARFREDVFAAIEQNDKIILSGGT